jgi:hypothetical protein
MPLHGLHVQFILRMIMLQNDADLIIDLIRMDERVVSVRLYPALTIFRSYVSPTVFSSPLESCYIVLFM